MSQRVRCGLLIPLVVLLLLAGCGYRFSAGDGPPSVGSRSVFVDGFTNRTAEPYAGNVFRSAFISRFVQEGRYRLAGSRGEADLICRGTVRSVQTAPLAYRANNLTAEDRLTVILELSFEERESGRVLWREGAFSQTGDYPVTTAAVTESRRRVALEKLAADTAERAYRLLTSAF